MYIVYNIHIFRSGFFLTNFIISRRFYLCNLCLTPRVFKPKSLFVKGNLRKTRSTIAVDYMNTTSNKDERNVYLALIVV